MIWVKTSDRYPRPDGSGEKVKVLFTFGGIKIFGMYNPPPTEEQAKAWGLSDEELDQYRAEKWSEYQPDIDRYVAMDIEHGLHSLTRWKREPEYWCEVTDPVGLGG